MNESLGWGLRGLTVAVRTAAAVAGLQRIIAALQEAVAGNLARATIGGRDARHGAAGPLRMHRRAGTLSQGHAPKVFSTISCGGRSCALPVPRRDDGCVGGRGNPILLIYRRRAPMPARGRRKPSISFGARISLEDDALRRELEAKLNVSASQLIGHAFAALARELAHIERPAE
jgi:hypothetical protein